MRLLQTRGVYLVVSLFPVLSNAITLSNFSPKIDNLNFTCQSVYDEVINGCQATDFTSGSTCSASCVNGVVDIQGQVQSACASSGASTDSIIGVALQGQLVTALCPNVAVTSLSSAGQSTTAAPRASSTGGFVVQSSSSLVSSFSTSTISVSSSSNITTTSEPTISNTSSRTLSAGAKAGIGVGVALGVILIIILSAVLIWMRRRSLRPSKASGEGWMKPELDDTAVPVRVIPELEPTNAVAELEGTPILPEMGSPVRGELPHR